MHDLEVDKGEQLFNKFIENNNSNYYHKEDSQIFYESYRFKNNNEVDPSSNVKSIFDIPTIRKIQL